LIRSSDIATQWWATSLLPGRLAEFSLGMLAAWQIVTAGTRAMSWRRRCVYLLVAAACFIAGMKSPPFMPFADLLWGVGYFCILKLALADGWFKSLLSLHPLARLGEISYSFYLLHLPVLVVLSPLMGPCGGQISKFLALLVVVGFVAFVFS